MTTEAFTNLLDEIDGLNLTIENITGVNPKIILGQTIAADVLMYIVYIDQKERFRVAQDKTSVDERTIRDFLKGVQVGIGLMINEAPITKSIFQHVNLIAQDFSNLNNWVDLLNSTRKKCGTTLNEADTVGICNKYTVTVNRVYECITSAVNEIGKTISKLREAIQVYEK